MRWKAMTAERVLELLDALDSSGVKAWIDGGWGVDALLRRQSRSHDDLDLVVALDDVRRIVEALGALGFRVSEDQLPIRFVMTHEELGQIDFHTVSFDEEGGGLQPQPGGGSIRWIRGTLRRRAPLPRRRRSAPSVQLRVRFVGQRPAG